MANYRLAIQNCNSMDVRIVIEWEEECGIKSLKMLDLTDEIENKLKGVNYGTSITHILIGITCMARDFKQRKRFKKDTGRFEYDILLDYFLIKNVEVEEKKKLIKYQMIKVTEQTFSKYKFEDFNTSTFLLDFKNTVESIQW